MTRWHINCIGANDKTQNNAEARGDSKTGKLGFSFNREMDN